MEYADLQQRLRAAVERYDSQTFLGSYRETTRGSLLNEGLSTRANSLWKMAEYVVAKKDAESPDGASSGYLVGWRTLASNYNNQTLLLEVSDGVWEMYDAQGVKLGGEEYIKDILEKRRLERQSNQVVAGQAGSSKVYQLIKFGAPGTGKSFGLDKDTANEENVFRVTFHPDSDYASFVGAYKPTMESAQRVIYVNDGKMAQLVEGPDNLKYDKKISYEFVPQAFMNAYVAAWKNYATAGAGISPKDVFLIIEEINRGNCAQVFGDVFQLLDRSDAGWSTYPVLADHDLGNWLNEKHFGTAAFAALANKSAPDKIKISDWNEVRKGRKLLLPPNLYIWATMNTSDQSLFPIDSAFKRRWDWKYVPIREGKYKDGPKLGQKMNWKIRFSVPQPSHNGQAVPDKIYNFDWWGFLENINAKIFKTTESEDKKLGYFFVKPDGEDAQTHDGTISADRFVGKVVFYLWNDVFKDYGIESIFKNEQIEKKNDDEDGLAVAFERFFDKDGDKADPTVVKAFFKALEFKSDEEIAAAKAGGGQAAV